MTFSFQTYQDVATFHDPMQAGTLIDRVTEIRIDPITGESSRIIYDPGAPFVAPDYTALANQTAGEKCPFCDENIWDKTPTYPGTIAVDGRIQREDSVLFPNIFPYVKHNAVVRMTNEHYVPLANMTASMIVNSLQNAAQYLKKVRVEDGKALYQTINWNYLPPSGGSILHPHLHVMASEQPTNYQRAIIQAEQQYYAQHQQRLFDQLIEQERQLAERWIGTVGSINWLHAFAPKSHYDFIGVIASDDEATFWTEIADSLLRFFAYFQSIGVASFNCSLFLPVTNNPASRPHIRLVPRFTIGLLQTSDMNVLNFLQQEYLSLKVPEQTALQVQPYFL